MYTATLYMRNGIENCLVFEKLYKFGVLQNYFSVFLGL